jgi:hypothetical protein
MKSPACFLDHRPHQFGSVLLESRAQTATTQGAGWHPEFALSRTAGYTSGKGVRKESLPP